MAESEGAAAALPAVASEAGGAALPADAASSAPADDAALSPEEAAMQLVAALVGRGALLSALRVINKKQLAERVAPLPLVEQLMEQRQFKDAARGVRICQLHDSVSYADVARRAFAAGEYKAFLGLVQQYGLQHALGGEATVRGALARLIAGGSLATAVECVCKMRVHASVLQQFGLVAPLLEARRYDLVMRLGGRFDIGAEAVAALVERGDARVAQVVAHALSVRSEALPRLEEYSSPACDNVVWVDDPADVAHAVQFFRDADVVGIDMEAQPSWQRGVPNILALLQLSARERTFLFDMTVMRHSAEFHSFFGAFLRSPATKVGVGVDDDIKQVRASCAVAESASDYTDVANVVNLVELAKHVEPFLGASLQKLTIFALGRLLNKSMQVSNWAHRPLTAEQLRYAAADAAVAVDIFCHFRAALTTEQVGGALRTVPLT